MIYIIIVLSVIVINLIFLRLYCEVQFWLDNKKFIRMKAAEKTVDQNHAISDAESGTIRKLYTWLNSYLYGWMRFNLVIAGRIPSYRIRKYIYKYIFKMMLNKGTVIFLGSEIRSPWNITIGRSTISSNCILDGRNKIIIGDDVVFGSGVHVWTEEHDLNDPYFRVLDHNRQPVIIENRAWICSDSTLLPGVVIKEGAVVASKACVTKNCDAYCVYGGVPAKRIGDRERNLKYHLTGKPTWHFY